VSFFSSRPWTTGMIIRAPSDAALASSVCVSRVPPPAASSVYALVTFTPLVSKRVSAPAGGS
jgi:hypothetical protein